MNILLMGWPFACVLIVLAISATVLGIVLTEHAYKLRQLDAANEDKERKIAEKQIELERSRLKREDERTA